MIPDWLKPKTGKEAGMYNAYPTRLHKEDVREGNWYYRNLFKNIARANRFAPLDPFECGDVGDWEGGLIGREDTLDWTMYMQRWFKEGWTGCFGISEGVMKELKDRLAWDRQRRIRVFYGYDPLWEEEYERWKPVFGDVFNELRGSHCLFVCVGASASGKTFWTDRSIKFFNGHLRRVKNVTTRKARNRDDKKSYHIVGHDVFWGGIAGCVFLEYDQYLGEYYGSSLEKIRSVLRCSSGVMAMTPKGAEALYKHRFEINIQFILFQPVSDNVLRLNLRRRGIINEAGQNKYIEKAKDFILPDYMKDYTVVVPVTGNEECDRSKIFDAFGRVLK